MAVPLLVALALSAPTAARAAGHGFKGRLWGRTLDGPGHGADTPSDMAVSPDGATVFVTGYITTSVINDATDYLTVAYDASSGVTRWIAHYNDAQDGYDSASALALGPDGSTVYVTGTGGHGFGSDYTTIAYDAFTGRRKWIAHYKGNSQFNFGYAIAVSPDGSKVFVSGEVGGGQNTVAYDAATGAQLWPITPRQRANSDLIVYALAVSPDGSTLFATGSAGLLVDYETVAYDTATGTIEWTALYNGPGNSSDDAQAIAVSPDGTRVVVAGSSWGVSRDYATIAYDAATGSQVWVSRYDGSGQSYDDAWDLTLSPDGSTAYVTGDSTGIGTSYDYATVAYDTVDGSQQWVGRYDAGGAAVDEAYGVRASPDGASLYVTGYSSGQFGVAYTTVAYDALTGSDEGVVVARTGQASTIRVSPDGTKLFVTGSQGGFVNASTTNYGTIAYLIRP